MIYKLSVELSNGARIEYVTKTTSARRALSGAFRRYRNCVEATILSVTPIGATT